MRTRYLALIGCALLASTPEPAIALVNPPASSLRSDPADATRRLIGQAHAQIGQEAWADALVSFRSALDSPGFERISRSEQYTALSRAGKLAADHDTPTTAHRWLLKATGSELASSDDWHRRLSAAYDLKNYADSARCIATIARRWPDSLVTIRAQAIHRVANQLDIDPAQRDLQRDLLQSLFDVRWTDDGIAPDFLWRDLVRLQLSKGDVARAAEVAQRVTFPRNVLALRLDQRFDALTQRDGFISDTDVVINSASRHAEARERAAPQVLGWRVDVLELLLDRARFDDVIGLADEVIQRVNEGDGATYYTDFADKYPWVLDQRARALQGLGRWDEAMAQMRKASRRPEGGEMNISQSLNLGMLYADLERADDALEMTADLGSLNGYGNMVLHGIALRAAIAKGDAAGQREHLAYLREHRDDAIGLYQEGLLLSEDVDAAADLLIERLRNERERGDALLAVQTYIAIPRTPMAKRIDQQWQRVRALPRVQAELSKAGRFESIKLTPPDF